MTALITKLSSKLKRASTLRRRARFAAAAQHISGPVALGTNTVAPVIIVPRWRLGDLPAFFEHYRQLGATHFVFFAADAPADVLAHLMTEPGTTIVKSGLGHTTNVDDVLAHCVEAYAKNRWCLIAQSGQLLEFQGAERIGFQGLIAYLENQGATRMVIRCLTMFPKGPLGAVPLMDLAMRIKACTYFDLSESAVQNAHDGLRDTSENLELPFFGKYLEVSPKPKNEKLGRSSIADISGVFKDYQSACDLGVSEPDTVLFSLTSRRWNRAALLTRAGFLQASDAYGDWIERAFR